jgi:hypothetical protein
LRVTNHGGTELLKNNDAADAFIVKRIKGKGGIIR